VLFAVYEFVGVFGASTLVGLLEEGLFEGVLNPAFESFVEGAVAWPWFEAGCVRRAQRPGGCGIHDSRHASVRSGS